MAHFYRLVSSPEWGHIQRHREIPVCKGEWFDESMQRVSDVVFVHDDTVTVRELQMYAEGGALRPYFLVAFDTSYPTHFTSDPTQVGWSSSKIHVGKIVEAKTRGGFKLVARFD